MSMASHTETGKIKVLIADDHTIVRRGLASILHQEKDMEVVAEASVGTSAVQMFCEYMPDIALIDLRMPGLEGTEIVKRIRDAVPDAKIIIISTFEVEEDVVLAFKAGARAYILKDIAPADLIHSIRCVLSGDTLVSPRLASKLASHVSQLQLTMRELTVLRLLATGKVNKEIATELNISDGTVKAHITNLFEKLGVSRRTEAVALAAKRGLLRMS